MRFTERDDVPVSVLGRAFEVLGCFSHRDREMSLTEIVRATGMPKATVYRLLQELIRLGALERVAARYRVGLRMFELGQLAHPSTVLHEKAVPLLSDLRHVTQGTVHLGVLDGTDVVYLEKIVGPRGPRIPSRLGGRMPAYCTGIGKALLAFTASDAVQEVIAAGLERRTSRTIVMPGLLMRELASARDCGIAYENEESALGVICVAAPVLDTEGVAIAAISVAGLGNTIDPQRVAPAVRSAALSLSRQLVAVGNAPAG